MASKAVTGKLIDDGIIGKSIGRRRRINSKNHYDLLRVGKFMHKEDVYVISQKDEGLTAGAGIQSNRGLRASLSGPLF